MKYENYFYEIFISRNTVHCVDNCNLIHKIWYIAWIFVTMHARRLKHGFVEIPGTAISNEIIFKCSSACPST